MAARKIVDETEVMRWFEEGRTYAWMQQQYMEKYNIETRLSMWANFRRRKGLDLRIARNAELIPWHVELRHRYDYPILMLRKEARRRSGFELSEKDAILVDAWIDGMRAAGTVLHYDPDTKRGWFYVEARPGIDTDIIRVPDAGVPVRVVGE